MNVRVVVDLSMKKLLQNILKFVRKSFKPNVKFSTLKPNVLFQMSRSNYWLEPRKLITLQNNQCPDRIKLSLVMVVNHPLNGRIKVNNSEWL